MLPNTPMLLTVHLLTNTCNSNLIFRWWAEADIIMMSVLHYIIKIVAGLMKAVLFF